MNNIENAASRKTHKSSNMKRRERLSDISNLQLGFRNLPTQEKFNLGPIPQTNACIADLLKENTALMKLLGEQNKIIEMNAQELHKLRVSFHQLQQQNCHLAKANTSMLEDLNQGKDRLKALQHELGCTVAVLKTTKLELEETKKSIPNITNTMILEELPSRVDSAEEMADKVAINPKRKLGSRRLSLGSSIREESAVEKGRRSSIKTLKSSSSINSGAAQEQQQQHLHEQLQAMEIERSGESTSMVLKKEGSPVVKLEEDNSVVASVSGRPQRRSTVGVSYKEKPLNVKMRRA